MTGRFLKRLRGSLASGAFWCWYAQRFTRALAWVAFALAREYPTGAVLRGLVSSMRPARCCSCRVERDRALLELARLRDRAGPGTI